MFLYQKYKYDYKHLDINNPSHLSYLRELINIAEEVKTEEVKKEEPKAKKKTTKTKKSK